MSTSSTVSSSVFLRNTSVLTMFSQGSAHDLVYLPGFNLRRAVREGCENKNNGFLQAQRRHEHNSKSDWRALRETCLLRSLRNPSETWPLGARSFSTPRVDSSRRAARRRRRADRFIKLSDRCIDCIEAYANPLALDSKGHVQ